jgi:cytochrome d ubiquinol oxidase subunit I
MVGIGTALVALGLWALVIWRRRRDLARSRWFLRAASVAGVAAILALEAGWIVTEVGRQPWVVYGILRTRDAVTQSGGVRVTFTIVIVLYAVLGIATLIALRALARRWAAADLAAGGRDTAGGGHLDAVPYGPPTGADDEGTER